MKRLLLLSAISITLLSSCSTAYKAGQTPDDIYYSPGREIVSAKDEERQQKQQDQYEDYISSQDDRYLRMKVANRSRWTSLDDYDYWYDSRYDFCRINPYTYNNYGYNYWNTGWSVYAGYGRNYYGGWNSPIYTLVAYGNPKFGNTGYTSGSNISAYRNKGYTNSNLGYKDPKSGVFVPANNGSNFGNLLKRVFTNGSSSTSNNSSFDRPVRTFSNPTNSSTPATSSSAGGRSGGVTSTGTSTSTGRGGKG